VHMAETLKGPEIRRGLNIDDHAGQSDEDEAHLQ